MNKEVKFCFAGCPDKELAMACMALPRAIAGSGGNSAL
jgi:hypothetical protein